MNPHSAIITVMFTSKLPHVSRSELFLAQLVLYIAIGLQISTWVTSGDLSYGPHPLIIISELVLVTLLGLSARHPETLKRSLYRTLSFAMLGLISAENISSVIIVLNLLVTESSHISGYNLLASAIAIFLTNIIVFALWYWEIDSPGLSGKKWSKHDKDFQFTQQDLSIEFREWQPSFPDYLYLSITNAINFAPADARPLTHQAKLLMGIQSLVSVSIVALIIARSVSILGQ
jgi:uncharacterized membrane protein